jgi:hypothetical protein
MNQASRLMLCAALVVSPWTASAAEDAALNPMQTFNRALAQVSTARFLPETELGKLAESRGGGTVKTFTSKKYQRSVKVVLRSQTSGIPSTEALFFSSREVKPGWQLVLHYPLVFFETLDVEEKVDGLLLYAFRHEDKLKIERLFVRYETLVGPIIADRIAYPLQQADGK